MTTLNEQLLDDVIRHQVYLLRYSATVRDKVIELINKTEADIARRIRGDAEALAGLSSSKEWKRLQALLAALEGIRKEGWKEASDYLLNEMEELAYVEPVAIDNTMQGILPVEVTTVLPSSDFLRAIALQRPFEGKVLKDWADSMAADDIRRIHSAVQAGMIAGEDHATIARRVVGSGPLVGADGVTQMTRKQIETVVNTAVQSIANGARDAYFNANKDILSEEQFVATLDSHTTPICRALDGKRYDVGLGPRPPLHFRCRSLRVPAIDGAMLGDRPAKPVTEKILIKKFNEINGTNAVTRADLPRGMKGEFDAWARKEIRRMTGPVPATQTYQTWLKKQSHDFQDEILGPERAQLFRDGKLELDKFVDLSTGRQFTLDELRAKYPGAFKADGGGGTGGSTMSAPPGLGKGNEPFTPSLQGPPTGGTRLTIWDHADAVWKEAGSPTDPAAVLELRKRMMNELELKGVKRTTSSNELGVWMRERLNGVLPDKLPPAPKVTPPPVVKPTPKEKLPKFRTPDESDIIPPRWGGWTPEDLDLPRLPSVPELDANYDELAKMMQTLRRLNNGDPANATALAAFKKQVRETFIKWMTETQADLDKAAAKAAAEAKRAELFSKPRVEAAPRIYALTSQGGGKFAKTRVDSGIPFTNLKRMWNTLPDWATNLLADTDVNMRQAVRAYYDWTKKLAMFSQTDGVDIFFHEFFHGIDFAFRKYQVGSRWYVRDSLDWKSGDATLDRLAAETAQEFRDRDSRGRGTFSNGDGEFMLGNWYADYEGRMYAGMDQTVSSEYITMAAQSYGKQLELARRTGNFAQFNSMREARMNRQPKMIALLDYIFGVEPL